MMLASGTRVGPYEIVSSLGAGGMEEVELRKAGLKARLYALSVRLYARSG